jgi:AcrR family transcriptional regulator
MDEGSGARSDRPGPGRVGARREGVGREHPDGHTQRAHTQRARGGRQVAAIQRARIVAAMSGVACEQGYANATIAAVVARSGVSRRTFYELFDDREQCFLAALEEGLARACERVREVYDPRAPWRVRIRAALAALLSLLDEQPELGRLLVVEALSAGSTAARLRLRMLARAAAPVPRPTVPPAREPAAALGELGVRITYRTLRVLAAIGQAPGASNRLVAELAGISDQGQISKLLRRLERVGLVRSDGNGPRQGHGQRLDAHREGRPARARDPRQREPPASGSPERPRPPRTRPLAPGGEIETGA